MRFLRARSGLGCGQTPLPTTEGRDQCEPRHASLANEPSRPAHNSPAWRSSPHSWRSLHPRRSPTRHRRRPSAHRRSPRSTTSSRAASRARRRGSRPSAAGSTRSSSRPGTPATRAKATGREFKPVTSTASATRGSPIPTTAAEPLLNVIEGLDRGDRQGNPEGGREEQRGQDEERWCRSRSRAAIATWSRRSIRSPAPSSRDGREPAQASCVQRAVGHTPLGPSLSSSEIQLSRYRAGRSVSTASDGPGVRIQIVYRWMRTQAGGAGTRSTSPVRRA